MQPFLRFVLVLVFGSVFAGGVKGQLVSVAFDPPRELVLGPLDETASPPRHKERGGLNPDLDIDFVSDLGFKLQASLPMFSGLEFHHRLSTFGFRLGAEFTGSPYKYVLTKDSLDPGSFVVSGGPYWDLRFTASSSAEDDIRYIPCSTPVGPSLRYGWIRVSWNKGRYLVHGWQLQDSLDLIDPVGDAPTVGIGTAAAAFAVRATDVGESGTAADLEIAFRRSPGESGVAEYRILLIPDSLSNSFDRMDALAVPVGSYRTHIPDSTDPVLAYGPTDLDINGQSLFQNTTYRVLVLSMPDSVSATRAKLTKGSTIQLRLRAQAPENIRLIDSLDQGLASDFYVQFEPPAFEANVAGYWCALERLSDLYESPWDTATYVGMDADSVLVLPMDRRFHIPASGSAQYGALLPTGLLDAAGQVFDPTKTYRIVVASDTLPGAADFPFAAQSGWNKLSFPTRIATDVDYNADGNHLDGRLLRMRFAGTEDETGILEYRLFASTFSSISSNIDALMSLDSSRYVAVVPNGSTLYGVHWEGKRDTYGDSIMVDEYYRGSILAVGDSIDLHTHVLAYLSPTSLAGRVNQCVPNKPEVHSIGATGNSADVSVSQDIPFDSVGLESMRFVLLPGDSVLDAETMLAMTPDRYTERPPGPGFAPLSSGMLDAYGQSLVIGALYRVQSQFIPDGIDASVYPVSPVSDPIVISDTISSASNLWTADQGASGTGRDLKIAFEPAPVETGIVAYRVLVQSATGPVGKTEIESAATGRYIDLPSGDTAYALSAKDLRQILDGNSIGRPEELLVVVASMDASGNLVGRTEQSQALTDTDVQVRFLSMEDVSDYGDARDAQIRFEPPTVYSDSVGSIRVGLYPVSSAPGSILETLLAASSDDYLLLPPSTTPTETLLPGFGTYTGDALIAHTTYGLALASEVVLEDTVRYVLSNGPSLAFAPVDWPVISLRTFEQPWEVRVAFLTPPEPDLVQEFRLLFARDPMVLTPSIALNAPPEGYTVLDRSPTGSRIETVSGSTLDVEGNPIQSGMPMRAYVLSYVESGHGSLARATDPFTLMSVGLSPPAKSSFTLATAPEHWLLSADRPIEAVEVYDATGRLLHQAHPGDFQHRIPTAGWPMGSYLIRAQIEGSWQATRTALVR